ncbi:hypothetical protein ACFRAR_31480 [Kitasatospora sp. NPDC056651]|uniref:hypothetical protein n=1 Tax=Kitasatospora sp. NPDC056651 TaxID=3345892 RepID=UPI0036A708C2
MDSREGPVEHPRQSWPSVELDAVSRLRVLAVGGNHPLYAERVLPASFDEVWSVASDLEHELPRVVNGLRSFTLDPAEPDAERQRAVAVSAVGTRERFDVLLRPGWCLMQSKAVVGGMAAVAEPDGRVRFALFGGVRLPVAGRIRRAFRTASVRRGERFMDRLEERVVARGSR